MAILYGYYGYGYGYGYMNDPMLLWAILVAVISMIASAKVSSTYRKYNRVRSAMGLTGAQAAERILHSAGIYDVSIEHIRGELTDHYDPRNKVLRLSDATYGSVSVAAVGVAAHECGHAIQHQEEYAPLKFRSALVPAANLGSRLGLPLILLGFAISAFSFLVPVGIIIFSLAVLFQIVTLPVEFDASKRALVLLKNQGILGDAEVRQSRKVLSAAALTYVAAAAASVVQLIRLILIFGGGRRRND